MITLNPTSNTLHTQLNLPLKSPYRLQRENRTVIRALEQQDSTLYSIEYPRTEEGKNPTIALGRHLSEHGHLNELELSQFLSPKN